MAKEIKTFNPPFTILKRDDIPKNKALAIRILSYIGTFLFTMLLCTFIVKDGLFKPIGVLFEGAFANIWKLLLDSCLLLAFGLAIVPAFKMKYWNMGANGQVLIGALVAIVIMYYMKDFAATSSFNNFILIIIMLIGSIIASVIWAVIPAIFKVFFNTNETLFTLMMNYIASGLVAYVNFIMAQGKKENPGIINADNNEGWLPRIFNTYYFIPIVIIILMAVFVYFYMKKTKQGYEVTVVGDSINTAKYVGMNTKKIIIRTLVLSGIMCGIIGFLYSAAINHSVNKNTCGSLGFTAVLVAWMSNFNPLTMGIVSFALSFLTIGTSKVNAVYSLGSNDLSSVIIGMIFFAVLICEFFIKYRVKFNFKKNKINNEEVGAEKC